jgi:hypothetical protein
VAVNAAINRKARLRRILSSSQASAKNAVRQQAASMAGAPPRAILATWTAQPQEAEFSRSRLAGVVISLREMISSRGEAVIFLA